MLEKNNIEVEVIDLNKQSESELWSAIETSNIIGISMLSYARSQAFKIIRDIRTMYGNRKKIVLGGIFSTMMYQELMEKFPIDAIVIGEGEQALLELCLEYETNGELSKQFYQSELMNLDDIPFPAWEYSNFDWWNMQIAKSRPNLEINGLRIGNLRWSPIIASRGCVGRCIFCNAFRHWGYKIRFRSAQNIADEIELLVNQHNVRLFSFDDDAFPYNRQQCMELCNEILKRNLKIAWKADTRADVFDKEMLEKMHEAGCFMLAIGIESASQKILDRIKKNLDLDKARQAIKDMKEVGILAYTLLMVGNVGETKETIQETKQFLDETKPDLNSFVTGVMVIPKTEMQEIAKIPDEYYLEGDGLPFYTKEHSMNELREFAGMLN
jgi:radical SAM superfamily enzyme YgiQ (UPF0313 family)